ncbi:MAG: ATP-binding cassette domain-containing protein [Verrucomicrobia bacterium]|nr:MAG: ATP-binding cassette domain-containing protein [Verrucomicrobiota bacterium]
MKPRGVARGEIKTRVCDAAAMFRESHCLDRKPGKLSGGKRQRVALACALVRKAKKTSPRRTLLESGTNYR